jgi:predicted nuclease of predicted toxin-antitoxin system
MVIIETTDTDMEIIEATHQEKLEIIKQQEQQIYRLEIENITLKKVVKQLRDAMDTIREEMGRGVGIRESGLMIFKNKHPLVSTTSCISD